MKLLLTNPSPVGTRFSRGVRWRMIFSCCACSRSTPIQSNIIEAILWTALNHTSLVSSNVNARGIQPFSSGTDSRKPLTHEASDLVKLPGAGHPVNSILKSSIIAHQTQTLKITSSTARRGSDLIWVRSWKFTRVLSSCNLGTTKFDVSAKHMGNYIKREGSADLAWQTQARPVTVHSTTQQSCDCLMLMKEHTKIKLVNFTLLAGQPNTAMPAVSTATTSITREPVREAPSAGDRRLNRAQQSNQTNTAESH